MKKNLDCIYAEINEIDINNELDKIINRTKNEKLKNCLSFYDKNIDIRNFQHEDYKNDLIYLVSFVLENITNDRVCDSEILNLIASIMYKLVNLKQLKEVGIVDDYYNYNFESSGC